jgi:RNA polymerase sigma-70 factor, ECF subfamily
MQNNKPIDSLETLIEKAQSGDIHAFEKIVVRHQSYAFAIAFRYICDEFDAEEIVQESFIRIWSHLQDFDSRTKFTTWMYKIVVNLCYDKTKSNKRRTNLFTRLNNDSFSENYMSHIDPEQELSNKEMAALIQTLGNGLSEKQRMIFLLRDLQDLSTKEVSDITGFSESAIKTNLCYARQHIRKKLISLKAII